MTHQLFLQINHNEKSLKKNIYITLLGKHVFQWCCSIIYFCCLVFVHFGGFVQLLLWSLVSDKCQWQVVTGVMAVSEIPSKLRNSVTKPVSAHLGSPPRERKSNFEVYFSARFKGKTVQCTMNELYQTGATREAAYRHCTMGNNSRKRVTQNPRPSEA